MSFTSAQQDIIGIVATNSQEYIDAVYAAFTDNNIVITLRSADDHERIEAASVNQIQTPGNSAGWVSIPALNEQASRLAQILFTSGTEGKPKGILLEHSALLDTTERLISAMELTSDIREYVGVPIYYSFGFGRVRTIGHINGKCYLPPEGFSPLEFAQMLATGEVNALSAVPTLLRLILQNAELFSDCGNNLQWMEIGSQYMSAAEKLTLRQLFPNAKIIQHYGLTEASRTTFLKIHTAPENQLESVGQCYGNAKVRINSDSLIEISGPHVAKQKLVNGQLEPLTDTNGWLTTTDQGHYQEGNLYYDGRADDVINCGGTKISPEALQSQIHQQLGQQNCVVIAKIPDDIRGENLLIAYLKSAQLNTEQLKQIVEQALNHQGIQLGNAAQYFPVDSFPTTETGKIQRRKLSEQFLSSTQAAQAIPDTGQPGPESTTDLQQDSLTQQLITLWEETLKIKPVSHSDSFFDLGGDSLSAIRISMKMEKLGYSKDICQAIFRGMTIAEIAAMDQPNSKATQQIVELWEETLKIKPVSQHDSFFDLGGDSLSAIRLSIKMEKLGYAKEVCQEIFKGKTIAQIVGLTESTTSKTTLSSASKSIDIMRGILVILVVASHWMPGVMAHLSETINEFNRYLSPLYSAGTPGFAVIFGIGVGFFNLKRYQNHPDSITPMVLQNIVILLVGVIALAIVKCGAAYANQIEITPIVVSNSLWTVITYYLLAMLTLPLWLKALSNRPNILSICIIGAAVFFMIHIVIDDIWSPSPSENPFLQTLILFGTAKYNYFEMSAGAFLGVAAGYWYRQQVDSAQTFQPIIPVAICSILLSIIFAHEMGQDHLWLVWPKGLQLWTWLFYLGVILLAINLLFPTLHHNKLPGSIEFIFNVIATLGTLAFPIFIGHEMVIPTKEVLSWLGIPGALAISLLLFFVPTIWYTIKLYNIYFGSHKSAAAGGNPIHATD